MTIEHNIIRSFEKIKKLFHNLSDGLAVFFLEMELGIYKLVSRLMTALLVEIEAFL